MSARDRCAFPLREAIRNACANFANGSRVTIWPARSGAGIDRDSGQDSIPGKVSNNENAVERKERTGYASASANEGLLCTDWSAWGRSLGATVFVASRQASNYSTHSLRSCTTADESPVQPGLLWRGSIVSAVTTVLRSAEEPSRASGSSPNPPSSSQQQQEEVSAKAIPTLTGFAIRIAASNFGVHTCHDGGRHSRDNVSTANASGGCTVGVTGTTAPTSPPLATRVTAMAEKLLARTSALRLARVVTPAAVARVCHLLADGALTPPLELFVHDPCRFPGSAAFLESCGKDGKGLLLVAAPVSPAAVAKTTGCFDPEKTGNDVAAIGAHAAIAEEGLAMVCFPSRTYCAGGTGRGDYPNGDDCDGLGDVFRDGARGSSEELEGDGREGRRATVWSVTLFRQPSEFSEEAVKALVGEGHRPRPEWSERIEQATTVKNENSVKPASRFSSSSKRHFMNVLGAMPRYTGDSLQREAATLVRQVNGRDPVPSPPRPLSKIEPSEPARRSCRKAAAKATEQLMSHTGPASPVDTLGTAAQPPGKRPKSASEVAIINKSGELAEGNGEAAMEIDGDELESSPTMANLANAVMDARAVRLRNLSAAHKIGDVGPQPSFEAGYNDAADAALYALTPAGAAATALVLYDSFGAWGHDDRLFWAEETLLPSSGDTSGVMGRPGTSKAARRERSGEGARTSSCSGAGGVDGGVGGGKPAAGAAGGVASSSRFVDAEKKNRPLSTAEEALEKAGRQQRERVKERKMVAREQRARMNCPRPRPRVGGGVDGGGGGGGGGGSSSSSNGVGSHRVGSGKGRFRRGSSTTASVAGPKLSRGSRLLGKSVEVGAAVAASTTPANPDAALGGASKFSGGGVGRRETVGGQFSPPSRRAIFQDGSTADPAKKGRLFSPASPACGSSMTKSISQVLAEEPSAFSPSPAAAVGGNSSYGSSTQAVTTAEERPVQPSAVGMPETGMTPAPEATRAVEDAATVGDGIGVTATLPVEVMAAAATVEGRGSTERVSNGEGPSGEGVEVDGGAASGEFSMRVVMERAMLSAIASQMGLPADDSRVREVFQRESRLMGGGVGATNSSS
ncbi:unnamed protein product [Sphacelaria rigidula]